MGATAAAHDCCCQWNQEWGRNLNSLFARTRGESGNGNSKRSAELVVRTNDELSQKRLNAEGPDEGTRSTSWPNMNTKQTESGTQPTRVTSGCRPREDIIGDQHNFCSGSDSVGTIFSAESPTLPEHMHNDHNQTRYHLMVVLPLSSVGPPNASPSQEGADTRSLNPRLENRRAMEYYVILTVGLRG